MRRRGGNKFIFALPHRKFFMFVNRDPCGFLWSLRGLRQGYPFSPILFILVMKALNRMMNRVVLGGYLMGFSVAVRGLGTSQNNPTRSQLPHRKSRYHLQITNETLRLFLDLTTTNETHQVTP